MLLLDQISAAPCRVVQCSRVALASWVEMVEYGGAGMEHADC